MDHKGLDHLAIAVTSTEEALKVWRDRLGFPVVCSEVVNDGAIRLTHLDLGNTHLQLVEPLLPDHPLQAWLKENGPGLHHFCLKVSELGTSRDELRAAGLAGDASSHQGTQGKRALFLTKAATQNVQVEVTGVERPRALPLAPTLAALPTDWPEDLLPALATAAGSAPKLVVLDDDPTGTQTVQKIQVVTDWSVETLAAALRLDDPGFFILTNSRSLATAATRKLHTELAGNLRLASAQTGVPFTVFSRSDSTLRGHFPLETDTLAAALGPFDGTLIAPYFEAGGRLTLNGVHYVVEGDQLVPAADTPFARDATFGYRESFLPAWVEEKTGGRVRAGDVTLLSLTILRKEGPAGVAARLLALPQGGVVVSDAIARRDIEILALGLMQAEAAGRRLLVRTAASLVAARLGQAPQPLLDGRAFSVPNKSTGGLIVVGSYVPKTTAQVRALRAALPVREVEIRVPDVLSPPKRAAAIKDAALRLNQLLNHGELALLVTSRDLVTGANPEESLAIVGQVSSAVVEVVRALTVRPRFLIAKGGITSSDVATAGLGVHRATVQGQLLPGVPVWRLGAESKFPGLDYVIFPGNVGGDSALVDAVQRLHSP